MHDDALYSDQELDEVSRFLRGAYVSATTGIASAKPRDPVKAVSPEVQRLKKKRAPKNSSKTFTDADLDELAETLKSPFASDLTALKERVLSELRQEIKKEMPHASNEPQSVPLWIMQSVSKRWCKPGRKKSHALFAITSTGLGAFLSAIGISPLFAPVAVWFATRLRDFGVPVFCDCLEQYLRSKGLYNG